MFYFLFIWVNSILLPKANLYKIILYITPLPPENTTCTNDPSIPLLFTLTKDLFGAVCNQTASYAD